MNKWNKKITGTRSYCCNQAVGKYVSQQYSGINYGENGMLSILLKITLQNFQPAPNLELHWSVYSPGFTPRPEFWGHAECVQDLCPCGWGWGREAVPNLRCLAQVNP